jgi:hypothetical protein
MAIPTIPMISDGTARRVAGERLDTTETARAFQQRGEIRPDLLHEIDAALAQEPAQHELRLLRRYVEGHGPRGPVTGW